MDAAAILFASASLPIIAFNTYWYREEKKTESLYGILAGVYAFLGAISVSYGFPGYLVLPITLAILGLGYAHGFFRHLSRHGIVVSALFIISAAAALTMEAFL